LGGAEPTVDYLKDMEIKEFQNKRKEEISHSSTNNKQSSKNLKVYNEEEDEDMANDLLGNYICITPKVRIFI
jgi:hypothetical protein